MELNERELRAFLKSEQRAPAESDSCPDELTIASYWDCGLTPSERAALDEHLAGCPSCFAHLGALARLEREPAEAVPEALLRSAGASARSGALSLRTGALAALAASLLAIVGLMLWLPEQARGPADLRSPIAVSTTPRLLHPADGGLLGAGESLRWSAVPGALFYRVRLATDSGEPLWEGETGGTELRVPATVELLPGRLYFVWVRAHRDDGKTIKSEAVAFRARAAPDGR